MRIVLYWTVISLAPVFLLLGMGLSSTPHLKTTERFLSEMPLLGSLLFQLLPVAVMCLGFSLFYTLMPNTRVKWRAALVGAFVAALLWHLNSSLSAFYVTRVVRESVIYGPLFLIPVFLVGLYLAWAILLFGCQVAYAWQMRVVFLTEKLVDNVNQRGREFVAIRLMSFIGRRYQSGEPPQAITEVAAGLRIPGRLVQEVIQTLVSARLLTEVVGTDSGYVPARPLETISCHDVLFAMRASQGMDLTESKAADNSEIYGEFQKIEDAERVAASSVTVRDLAERIAPPTKQLADVEEQSDAVTKPVP
jgi:membrane protein